MLFPPELNTLKTIQLILFGKIDYRKTSAKDLHNARTHTRTGVIEPIKNYKDKSQ